MTTIDDLDIKSILDMSSDEAIEHLRQIRLSRRTPIKRTAPKKAEKLDISAVDAAELLKLLES